MENAAKLAAALSALFGAIAWPIVVLMLGRMFQSEVKAMVNRSLTLLERMRKIRIGHVEALLDESQDP